VNVKLLRHRAIDYPSGSALEYYNHTLFVIGDDAHYILCLDDSWNEVSRINLGPYKQERIPKPEKHDAECATVIGDVLYVLGSGSVSPQRDLAFIIQLSDYSVKKISTAAFYAIFRDRNLVNEMNIEGFTDCKDKLLFFNRANTSQPNQLIVSDQKILKKQFPDKFKIMPVEIEALSGLPLGISGACYSEDDDLLLLTASAERTDNAYDDGEIEGSVFAVIPQAYNLLNGSKLKIEHTVKLDEVDVAFFRQKIESVCIISRQENLYRCVLVADNDDGKSVLFEVEFAL
jgi:hypothetical protein